MNTVTPPVLGWRRQSAFLLRLRILLERRRAGCPLLEAGVDDCAPGLSSVAQANCSALRPPGANAGLIAPAITA
jgi:hypothetical protein